jgi:hypothetical protein
MIEDLRQKIATRIIIYSISCQVLTEGDTCQVLGAQMPVDHQCESGRRARLGLLVQQLDERDPKKYICFKLPSRYVSETSISLS